MITLEASMPRKSKNYLLGQDVVWTQFNDVNFYVEDSYQENFYLVILRNLFPTLNIKKIFPLGGKPEVVKSAKRNQKNNRKVYLLDLDFDEILSKKETLNNLFYLKKYSIENYLIDKLAIVEFIKEEHPKIKEKDILSRFNLKDFYQECYEIYSSPVTNLFLINKYALGIKYLKVEPHRDCNFGVKPSTLKPTVTQQFYLQIEQELKAKFPRLKYSAQVAQNLKYFRDIKLELRSYPGKYLVLHLFNFLKRIFKISQMKFETFVFRLAKNSKFSDLTFLKTEIESYIS